jgi:hypothetical protein
MNTERYNPAELTDAELAQIHGGGFLGDAWRAIKKVGKKVGEAVIDAIEYVIKHPPRTDWPPPGRPWPGY